MMSTITNPVLWCSMALGWTIAATTHAVATLLSGAF